MYLPTVLVYWPSEFIALKFGVLSAGIYDLGSKAIQVYWPSEFIVLKFDVLSAEICDLGSRCTGPASLLP